MSHLDAMQPTEPSDEPLRRDLSDYQRLAGIVGAGGLGLAILAALVLGSGEREAFLHSYIWAYAFWLGLALGCGVICMIHNLTGGRWGQVGKRIWLAGNGTMVTMAVLSLPLLIGTYFGYVWLWADPKVAATTFAEMPHKHAFFNPELVYLRGVFYFLIWIGTAYMLARAQRRIEATNSYPVRWFYARFSAGCIVLYVITVTFAIIDWVMSLEPYYYSTMYALIYAVGQALSAFALAIVVVTYLMRTKPYQGKLTIDQYADLGTMTFGFMVLWAYTAFFQLLISWMGNLQNEMRWYVVRNIGFWHFLAAMLIIFQFCAPFVLLLQRPIKRNPCILLWIAVGLLVMRLVDLYWLIKPAFKVGERVSWLDPVLLVGIGGVFVWRFLGKLQSGPLLPPPLLPGEHPPTGHGHAAFSHAAALAKAQGVQQV